MKIFKKIKSFLHISSIDMRESVKSAFKDDFQEKDVELIVNGLAKNLTPELQSTLVLSLINYRNKEIRETENRLNLLKDDKAILELAIITSNKET